MKILNWRSIALLAAVIAVPYLFFPGFHDRHSGMAQNESAAVGTLRRINLLENRYASSHPDLGFLCELSRLDPAVKSTDPSDPNSVFLGGKWSGYRFAITGCVTEQKASVARYDLIAVPDKHGISGVRAFCSDQTGSVYYDAEGSASECLRVRKQLPF